MDNIIFPLISTDQIRPGGPPPEVEQEEELPPAAPILVHLSEPDHEILGFFTDGDRFTGELPPAAELHEISRALHAEAVTSNATHMDLLPELRCYRAEAIEPRSN
jgi:hypothetical protein